MSWIMFYKFKNCYPDNKDITEFYFHVYPPREISNLRQSEGRTNNIERTKPRTFYVLCS